jgi:ADP-heptose:LPS heptosyltransferase
MSGQNQFTFIDEVNSMDKKNIILFSQGGIGDILMQTLLPNIFRRLYPDDQIIVACTYSFLFDDNPNVDIVHSLGADFVNLYEDYVMGGKCRFFKKHFIYDHIYDVPGQNCKNSREFVCNCYDVPYNGELPDYFVKEKEKKIAQVFLSQFTKPVILLHAFGSVPSEGQMHKVHDHKDLKPELLAQLVEKYKDQYQFVQIGLIGEPVITGAFDALGMPFREAAALVPECYSFVFIESSFAHISGALKKTGVVCFTNTSIDFFGYDTNVNIDAEGCTCPLFRSCCRPLGALVDMMPGYYDPKKREKMLWHCKDQLCKNIPFEVLDRAFLKACEKNKPILQVPAMTVEEARKK